MIKFSQDHSGAISLLIEALEDQEKLYADQPNTDIKTVQPNESDSEILWSTLKKAASFLPRTSDLISSCYARNLPCKPDSSLSDVLCLADNFVTVVVKQQLDSLSR